MDYQAPKGTHDIILEEALLFDEVDGLFRQMASLYGYTPIKTPMFEHTELFTRSVGEGSDIVRKEMYTFIDKGNRSITLRPEMTAGALRAIVSAKLDKTADLPLKVWYSGPAFRYERPQLGRYRQFHQFGIEAVGVTSPLNDFESIMLGYYSLQALGFDSLMVKINSLGDKETRDKYRDSLRDYFAPHIEDMCPDCQARHKLNPLRILDCKVPADQAMAKEAPKLKDFLSEEAKTYFESIIKKMDEYHIPYVIDDQLVRGLDYYSHVVFEYHLSDDKGKAYGALGAGGHYETLLEELGGSSLPGVGYALGLERIVAIIQELGISPDFSKTIDCYVMPLSKAETDYGYAVATLLRSAGLRTEMTYDEKSIKQQLKRATRTGSKFAIIIGEDERKKEKVTVKDLEAQTQETVAFNQLINYMKAQYSHHHHHDHDCQCEEGKCECTDEQCSCGGAECDCHEEGCKCEGEQCECKEGTCTCEGEECDCHHEE